MSKIGAEMELTAPFSKNIMGMSDGVEIMGRGQGRAGARLTFDACKEFPYYLSIMQAFYTLPSHFRQSMKRMI